MLRAVGLILATALLLLARAAGDEETPMRVGLLAQGVFWKGLFRDVEIVTWALSAPHAEMHPQPRVDVSVFYTALYKGAEAGVAANGTYAADALDDGAGGTTTIGRLCVPPATDLSAWLRTLDVFISFESPLLSVFSLALQVGVGRAVLVLNADWAVDKELRLLAANLPHKLDFWVKGPATQRTVREALAGEGDGIRGVEMVKRVPWTIPDTVVLRRQPPVDAARDVDAAPLPVTLLMIVGMGGVQSRRGVDIALRAFHLAMQQAGDDGNLHLLLSTTLYPFPVDANLLDHPNVTVLYQVHSREELPELVADADAVLYPSRWEGFGLSMMEALHAGVPVIATDGWPMNELLVNASNGILVPARNTGPFVADDHLCTIPKFPPTSCRTMLAPHWEVGELALAAAIVAFARDDKLRRRTSAPDAGALQARQRSLALVARRLLRANAPPSALLVLWDPAGDTGYGWHLGGWLWEQEGHMHQGRKGNDLFAAACGEGTPGLVGEVAEELVCVVAAGLRLNGYRVQVALGQPWVRETPRDGDRVRLGVERGAAEENAEGWDLVVVVGQADRGREREWFRWLGGQVGNSVVVWWSAEQHKDVPEQEAGGLREGKAEDGGCVQAAAAGDVDVCVSATAEAKLEALLLSGAPAVAGLWAGRGRGGGGGGKLGGLGMTQSNSTPQSSRGGWGPVILTIPVLHSGGPETGGGEAAPGSWSAYWGERGDRSGVTVGSAATAVGELLIGASAATRVRLRRAAANASSHLDRTSAAGILRTDTPQWHDAEGGSQARSRQAGGAAEATHKDLSHEDSSGSLDPAGVHLRLGRQHAVLAQQMSQAGLAEAAARHAVLAAAQLMRAGGVGSPGAVSACAGPLLARAAVALLRACRPRDAARAAAAALALARLPAARRSHDVALLPLLCPAVHDAGGDVGGVGVDRDVAGLGGEEVVDEALRRVLREQGPTCAGMARRLCGDDPDRRSRLGQGLAVCLGWLALPQ